MITVYINCVSTPGSGIKAVLANVVIFAPTLLALRLLADSILRILVVLRQSPIIYSIIADKGYTKLLGYDETSGLSFALTTYP